MSLKAPKLFTFLPFPNHPYIIKAQKSEENKGIAPDLFYNLHDQKQTQLNIM